MIDDLRKLSVRAKDGKTDKLFDAFFLFLIVFLRLIYKFDSIINLQDACN